MRRSVARSHPARFSSLRRGDATAAPNRKGFGMLNQEAGEKKRTAENGSSPSERTASPAEARPEGNDHDGHISAEHQLIRVGSAWMFGSGNL